MTNNTATLVGGRQVRSLAALPALLVAAFGFLMVLGIGFAHPETIHNAAHDSRHAFSFPCH